MPRPDARTAEARPRSTSASAPSSSTPRTLPAGHRLQEWLGTAPADTRLLILEFGAGFNTPGVIRRPGEHLARHFPAARLVRVNPDRPETPADLADRALPVPVGADHLLDVLTAPHPAPDPTVTP
ncbi:hypothetical protein [Streptomyces himastatinicus]|uniref:hypothetical protein n=1 Tax=Streptomyces himastatinicus TaxID=998084 RepID=UPI0001B4DEB4|nr:hypothetical protein [Streptomyces himastatinicus]